MAVVVRITQHAEADALLGRSALAVLVGTLLDWQMPLERAYAAPLTIARRLGRSDLDVHEIAAHDRAGLAALFSAAPAVHSAPALMARRVQELCRHLVACHNGEAALVWKGAATGGELFKRLRELPGFGQQKSQIFVALLAKRYGVRPDGWSRAAGPYGEDGVFRSAADVTGPESLERVRIARQEQRLAARRARPQGPTRSVTVRPGRAAGDVIRGSM
ncbi:HhH-GPD-type base excision DNA repair protein [Kitasatospora sp. NPDC096077]|uniref:HhH-GPD-type base excision DNA repair protein n=1 Tax=Kitasatospora sp. NPDC096077 TaxID=3155544 RepID=UPI00332B7022